MKLQDKVAEIFLESYREEMGPKIEHTLGFYDAISEDKQATIENFIHKNNPNFNKWYVGITKDLIQRLHAHNVINGDCFICVSTKSDEIARKIEAYFIDERGTQGGKRGGCEETVYVYAYLVNGHTRQNS